MRNFKVSLFTALLLIQSAFAGTSNLSSVGAVGKSSNDQLLSWIPLSEMPNMIAVIAGKTTLSTGNYFPFIRMDTGATYQVSTGKKFVVYAVLCGSTSSASAGTVIGYADTSVSIDSSTDPTNPVSLTVGNTHSTSAFVCEKAASGNYNAYALPGLSFPSGKYPYSRANQSSFFSVILIGKEV